MDQRMTRGEVLVALRKEQGLSQGDIAERAGLHISTVVRAEKDRPSEDATVEAIAKALGLSWAEFLATVDQSRRAVVHGEGEPRRPSEGSGPVRLTPEVAPATARLTSDLPVIAEGEDPSARPERRIARPADLDDAAAYAVRVRSDDMAPAYMVGMHVLVCPSDQVATGDRVYMRCGDDYLIRTVRRVNDHGWILEPINSAYPSRFCRSEDVRWMHRIIYVRERL